MTFQEKVAEKAEQLRQKAFGSGSDEDDEEASAGEEGDSQSNYAFLGLRAVSNANETKEVSNIGADKSNSWSLFVESLDAFEGRVKEQQQ